MATLRNLPYGQMHFLVDITDVNDVTTATGGFSEVSGLSAEITMVEYRNGNDRNNFVQKVMGLSKTPDVTLKRGVIGDLALSEWMDLVRNGAPPEEQYKTVVIKLLAEDRETVAQTWTLRRARPMKYTGPTLSGAGGELAVEELVLGCEHIEQS